MALNDRAKLLISRKKLPANGTTSSKSRLPIIVAPLAARRIGREMASAMIAATIKDSAKSASAIIVAQ